MDGVKQAIEAAERQDTFALLVILAVAGFVFLVGVVWRLYTDREKDRAQFIEILLEDIKSRNRLTESIKRIIEHRGNLDASDAG